MGLLLLGQGAFVLGDASAAPAPSDNPVRQTGTMPGGQGPARFLAAAVTLRQCYEWARERSEDLKIRQEDINQANARGRAALGGAYPYVDWKWTDTWQDPKGVDKLAAQGFSGFVEKSQVDSRFSIKQPIFSGLREWSAYSGFKNERTRNELLMARAEKELFAQTATAFYTVLLNESDRENVTAALGLAQDRAKELRGFRRLGKARDSEVYTAEAHFASLRAQLQQVQSRIVSSREDLSYLTGQDMTSVPLSDEIPDSPAPGALDEVIAQAKQRSDLRAQREEIAINRKKIRYQKGYYWPVVDVTGNYYTQRATFLDVIDWDVVLSVQVPLFQGGSVSARVKESQSAYKQSSLLLERMERDIIHSVRKIHSSLSSAVAETQSLEEAAKAAQQSYDSLMKEYKLGLVTNLEVIQAMDMLQAQRGAYDAARLNAKMLFIQLNVAVEKPL